MSDDILELIQTQKASDPVFAEQYATASRLLENGLISDAEFHTAVSTWVLYSIEKEVYQ